VSDKAAAYLLGGRDVGEGRVSSIFQRPLPPAGAGFVYDSMRPLLARMKM
jgi:hypothetical protein